MWKTETQALRLGPFRYLEETKPDDGHDVEYIHPNPASSRSFQEHQDPSKEVTNHIHTPLPPSLISGDFSLLDLLCQAPRTP